LGFCSALWHWSSAPRKDTSSRVPLVVLDGLKASLFVNPYMVARDITLMSRDGRVDAVRGTMELLTTQILRLLWAEGYEVASMGLAPLALLDDPDLSEHPRLTSLMRFVYQRVNNNYDFKLLYRYKAKYHPHAWEPRYFCFNQKRLTWRMLYAVIQVRNCITLRSFLRKRPQKIKGFQEKVESWKHAASFIAGLCSAIVSSSS